MSGHSKWSTIKRQKSIIDAKRGAVFTKLANLITIAAKNGGDVEMNPALKSAITQAKEANMPKNNIERAIKKGTGELGGDQIEEIYYEGVGPFGSQFIIKCLTDNKNRSIATVRHSLTKFGGSLGSVKWNFDLQGVIVFDLIELSKNKINLENLELELIDLAIVDFKKEADIIIVITEAQDLANISDFLIKKGIELKSTQLEYIAKEKQVISDKDREKLEKFIAELEDNEDVSDYYHNIESFYE
jgi:YebC/PmpR family DNA-binding regulatory protein